MEHKSSTSGVKSSDASKGQFIKGLLTGLVIVVIIGGVYFAGSKSSDSESAKSDQKAAAPTVALPTVPTQPSQPTRGKVAAVTDADHIKGNLNARITLIEYSDLECPFCQRFHPTAQQAVDEYGGDVAWVYRHFPLSIHANAQVKAEASECAAELGGNDGFWGFVDGLFEAGTSVPASGLAAIAGNIGISESDFQDCIDSERHKAKVQQQFASGQQVGVNGTPGTFVVNDRGDQEYVPGALPYASVKQIIDTLL